MAAKGGVRRLRSVARARDIDVFVQREAFFLGGAWSEWLASLRAPLIYDFDDAIWIRDDLGCQPRLGVAEEREQDAAHRRLAHTVIAGNEYLAAWAPHSAPGRRGADLCRHRRVRRRRDGPTARPGHDRLERQSLDLAHLRPLLPVLERVGARSANAYASG